VKLADRYELGEAIASGGMGVVLRARDERLGRDVAVKILPPDSVGSAVARERLLREARAAASLEHPGIVHVYDVGETPDGGAYLVMELVKGTSLRDAIAARAPGASTVLRWITEAGRALAFAHGRGIVHRDVKPDNVMIRDDGRAVLLDFGLAKPMSIPEGSPRLTGEGVIVGTPAYLAPEQAEGGEVDARADQFGLAVTAYESLTGRSPWTGTSSAHVIAAILRDDPPPPSALRPSLPREIDAPLLRAMAKRPGDRFPSMDAMVDGLKDIASKVVDSSGAGGAAYAPTETMHRSSIPTPQKTRAELVTEAELPRAKSRGSAARKIAAFAAVAVIAAIGVALRLSSERNQPSISVDASPPAPRPTAMTDLPVPPSKSAEAMAAYRTGMQSFHDGSVAATRAAFQRAVDLDPEYAAAHFRLGDVALGQGDLTTARAALATAMRLRTTLPEYERGMLEADEPLVLRSPPDAEEARRRVKALVDHAPQNAEYWAFLGFVDVAMHDDEAALIDAQQALAVDPQFGFGFMLEAWALAELGRHKEALAVYDECVAKVPAAIVCLSERAGELGEAGECERMAADVERIIAASPEVPTGYAQRAGALLARGAARATIEAAAEQSTRLRPEAARASWEMQAREGIALAFGDFGAVARDATADAVLDKTMDLAPRAAHARAVAEADVEMGRNADAARVARAYLQKRDLWIANGVAAGAAADATPRLVAIARDAGDLKGDDAQKAIDAFVARWSELDPAADAAARAWLAATDAVTTPADANAALAKRPADLAAPPNAEAKARLGEVYRLAGRLDEALPLLEAGARSCPNLYEPLWHVRASFHLAQAREAKGDAPGACEAYRAVLARWGNASPRSITAEQARARIKALACK
jgi:serine/threonine-protein kinase